MVELALCIGIIAFAMVAIMGVLPSGLTVQKQNREDTLIDQDGSQWINILREGQTGWGDLTNYLDHIQVEHTPVNVPSGRQVIRLGGPFERPQPPARITSAAELISLLSIPKYEVDSGVVYSNRVIAVFRSLSGAQNTQIRRAAASGAMPEDVQLEDAFRYQMEVELVPNSPTPTLNMTAPNPSFTNLTTLQNLVMGGYLNAYRLDADSVRALLLSPAENRADRDAFAGTLYDLRLTFRWPVFRVGAEERIGPGRRTFRTQVVGRPVFARLTNNTPNTVYLPGTSIRPRRFDPSALNRDLTP